MEITLIRHGKPALELTKKASSRDIKEIVNRYNLSGITQEPPPQEAKQRALNCNVVVCSDLARSIESAQALGFKEILLTESLFREVAIPHFNNGSLVMPVRLWSTLFRFLSVLGFSKNGESLSMARKRAKNAAAVLINVAQIHNKVMLVGHGFINYFIAKELLSQNWSGPSKPGRNFWEYGIYTYNTS